MFRDPRVQWQPFPSVLDGMKYPYVFDKGLWKGILHLIVLDGPSTDRAYGIKISCDIYLGIEERIYSMAEHDNESARYDGGFYLKKATNSSLITAYTKSDYIQKVPHQFLFIGNDYCFECLSFEEPIIQVFSNQEDAYAWQPSQETSTDTSETT